MIRVLAVAPAIDETSHLFVYGFQLALKEAVAPWIQSGDIYLHFGKGSEPALRNELAQGKWDVLHLFTKSEVRPAARYTTIALESASLTARMVSASYLCDLIGGKFRAVVFQAYDRTSSFDSVAESLVERCASTALTAQWVEPATQKTFLTKLYSGLATGFSAADLKITLADPLSGAPTCPVKVWSRAMTEPLFLPSGLPPLPQAANPAPAVPTPQPEVPKWRRVLDEKRKAGKFDVFLCHNGSDKPSVKQIGQKLKESGILPWLDEWELPPGQPWAQLLDEQIGRIGAAAVFVGSAGIGPWQEQEMYGFLREFVKRRGPVIPVLLPDAPLEPQLPSFLSGMTWVDFRSGGSEPLRRLIWGITGQRPGDD